MRRISGLLLILLISFCGGNEIVEDPITTTTSMMTLQEYEKGWIEKLEIYPVLTKDEFDKSIQFLLSYQILKENFPFTELEIIVDSKNLKFKFFFFK